MEAAKQSSGARTAQILLVEDHADSARVIGRLLEKSGYSVSVANTMARALELAKKTRHDVLICDLGLPDGDGLDLFRRLRQTQDIQGICLSGHGLEEDIEQSRKAGFACHLTKPIDFQKLESAVSRLVPKRN